MAMKKSIVKKAAPKKSSNMTPWRSVNDRLADAGRHARGAAHQVDINKAKGKKDNLDYRASKTATQRTADLNRMNSTSKTLGRAKNIVSKQAKKARIMKSVLEGKYKG